MVAIDLTADTISCDSPLGLVLHVKTFVHWRDGIILAVSNALHICIAHRHHGINGFVNRADVIPKINAGPQLLQNASILAAVF